VKRLLPRIGLIAFGLALLLSAALAFGEGLPLPVEKKIPAGEATIDYAGQLLRFTTSAPLTVKLWATPDYVVHYAVKVQPGYPIPQGPQGTAENNLRIYFINGGSELYDGGVPPGTLEGSFNSEGGFVDR
jgi:hypothetical protein